jgi:hypothetical protein
MNYDQFNIRISCLCEVHMTRLSPSLIVTALLALSAWTRGAENLPPGFDAQRHMRVSEVREGMRGYGLSVFRATKIEQFDVEVISILRNFNPKHDVILVRLAGADLEHTGAIAGMSGSPIFLKDESGRERMVGAFAYGWPFVKDPIGGVQPIEYMLGIRAEKKDEVNPFQVGVGEASKGRGQMGWSVVEGMQALVRGARGDTHGRDTRAASQEAGEALGGATNVPWLKELLTPLMVTGVPARVLKEIEPMLAKHGIVPLQAGGAGVREAMKAEAAELAPGSAMAVPILTGDVDMTAIGTCTEVLGNRVIGFGHPFFSEGDVALPMGSGYVHAVIPNLQNSFKLGSGTVMRGTLYADELTGVAGQLGDVAATIPIELRCVYADGSRDETFRFNAAQHPKLIPMLAATATSIATTASRELPQYHTVDLELDMEFANGQSLKMANRLANTNAAELFMTVGAPIMAASENPFQRVTLRKMTGTLRVADTARLSEILSVSMPKAKFTPGETIRAFVIHRPFRGVETVMPLSFELPRDLPDGTYDFAVLDWRQYLAEEQMAKPFRFTARSAGEVFEVLRDYTSIRRDALYLRLLRQPDGVAIGRTAMPRLPSSRRRVILGAGLSSATQFVSSTVTIMPADYLMSGSARFKITIDKEAKVETPAKAGGKADAPAPSVPAKAAEEAKPKAGVELDAAVESENNE